MSHAFTRTQITLSSQGSVLIASATFDLAASFSRGATESSRSRKVISAGTVGPFWRNLSFDPGTDKHERRGKSLLLSDMVYRIERRAHCCQIVWVVILQIGSIARSWCELVPVVIMLVVMIWVVMGQ